MVAAAATAAPAPAATTPEPDQEPVESDSDFSDIIGIVHFVKKPWFPSRRGTSPSSLTDNCYTVLYLGL